MKTEDINLSVIGLGYVGLPLAVEFGKKRDIIGYDLDETRISDLRDNIDVTNETTEKELLDAKGLSFTSEIGDLKDCNCFIIAVPTPIDAENKPNLKAVLGATEAVAKILKKNDIVIYESTVYPGVTEEECVPVLEKISELKFNEDFFCGYSPERINPGDKLHRISSIVKITSGSTPQVADLIDELYREIISAGTHKAESIKVAEAAKVIENTQRDLNIALINELAIIFDKLNIDTESVLKAAQTKWNFSPYEPGLVGGHCIGVDPYYLTYKAQKIGYSPELILSGRRINDGMGNYVASKLIDEMVSKGIQPNRSRVLILGFAFKENCPDVRNTRVIDISTYLTGQNCSVDIYDSLVDKKEAKEEYGIDLSTKLNRSTYDAIIIAVKHDEFREMGISEIKKLGKEQHIIYDLKYLFERKETDLRL